MKSVFRKLTNWFYRYHRQLGVLTGIPMIFWAISGITHPLMVHFFSTDIAQRWIAPTAHSAEDIEVSVGEILRNSGGSEIRNFRMVRLEEESCYQIQDALGKLHYFSARDGREIPLAEEQHAEHLARTFLQDFESPISEKQRITQFTGEYAYVNRLLPVWRIRFDRPDQMDVYVETFGERLGTFNDRSRRGYLWFFRNFHSWSFLGDRESPVRVAAIVGFSGLSLVVGITGIFLFFTMRTPRTAGKNRGRSLAIRFHRILGITFSVFMLGFAFSALLVAFPKFSEPRENRRIETPLLSAEMLGEELPQIVRELDFPVYNISAASIEGRVYYQFTTMTSDRSREVRYLSVNGNEWLEQGESQYAAWLAGLISGYEPQRIDEIAFVNQYGKDYPFIMKRLPVLRVTYGSGTGGGSEDWFVETSSGYLSTQETTASRLSGLGFVMLHKFHFLDFMGKETRDIILMLVTLFIGLVSLLGVVAYLCGKTRNRTRSRQSSV